MSAPALLVPPRPPTPAAPLALFAFLRALRANALSMWPAAAYEQDVVRRRLLGGTNLLINAPGAIRHILLDNADNYRRTHAAIRILRPITGEGLLLSTGEAWRHQRRTIAPALAPRMLPLLTRHIVTPRDLARRRFQRRWMALIEAIMRARLAAPATSAPRDLFDLLRAARDPDTGAAFSHDELRDQVATMILAGHETTAVALFWALTLLAAAPDAQHRIATEAAGADLSADQAGEAAALLPFTRAVVSETLRLYPPAFVIVRQAIAADHSEGIDIPRGAVVMIAPWVLHRHRKLWRDPDAFDPTRFLPDAPPPPRFAYLPFGAGPRVCVGAQFALTEATLALAALARAFHIARADATPVLPVAIVTTQPDHAPMFRLRKRSDGPLIGR